MKRRRAGSAWLAALVVAASTFFVSRAAAQTGVFREVYTGIAGNYVSNLTNHVSYPYGPSAEAVDLRFESPTNYAETFGARMRATLRVPATWTNYVFWIASDDQSVLYLSTNNVPSNKVQIAYANAATGLRNFTNNASQKSAAFSLTSNQLCYIEAIYKEGTGGDYLCVRWQVPSGGTNLVEEPIAGARLTPYGRPAPVISVQPTNPVVAENALLWMSLGVQRPLNTGYRWRRAGTFLSTATTNQYYGPTSSNMCYGTVSWADQGATFDCLVSNLYGAVTSATVTLTVVADTAKPTVAWAGMADGTGTRLSVLFSEAVDAATATNAANYTLTGGGTVTAARLANDGCTVVLTVSGVAPGAVSSVFVSGVRDRALAPNTILAGSGLTFTNAFTPLDVFRIRGTNEPAGPSSRRTPLAITEIMYNPAARADGRELEFVEIYNSQEWAEELGGFRFAGEFDYTFPSGTVVGARSYLAVAPVPDDVRAVYGITNVVGGFTGRLSNGGGTVQLRDTMGAVLLEAVYDDDPPWPVAPDGAGPSLVLARPSHGESSFKGWAASELPGGSPGGPEPPATNGLYTVFINEWLAHTDDPQEDFVELFNYGTNAAAVGGCWLSDDPATNKFRIPDGTTIPPMGWVAFTQSQMGFALDAGGETVLLRATNGTRVIDAVAFGPQANGVSGGRCPDGSPCTGELRTPTQAAANAGLLAPDLVIDEIMYHPIGDDPADEYIEIFNRGSQAVSLAGWRIRGGISYDFGAGTAIAAGGYLAIAADAARLRSNHTGLTMANCVGNFSGSLADSGERIALERPEDLIATNHLGVASTNWVYIVVDEVTYGDGGRWGTWSDGGGSSLELLDPASDNRLGPNWADSDESQKSDWVTIENTGVLDHGNTSYLASQLHLVALGAGEYLVDNVAVIPTHSGTNVLTNPGFESGTNNWCWQGTHEDSRVETGVGDGGGAALHVRAVSRGDTGANKVRANLSYTIPANSNATIRARIRWLAGHPEFLFRFRGSWLEATGPLLTTRDFGTPGAANSRGWANRGPVISSVLHDPILPAANQPIALTARVEDPDGIASVRLVYRIDPGPLTVAVPMESAGAGYYRAAIPGQPSNTVVAFWIEANDASTNLAVGRFPDDAPAREGVLYVGDRTPAGNFGVYRLWLTRQTLDRWTTREKNSNRPLYATFVGGASRVVYPAWTWYSGSPFHASGFNGPLGSTIPDYMIEFPKDDLYLGVNEFVLNYAKTENSTQRQQLSYWMLRLMGLPYLNRRYMQVMMNGNQRGVIFEDVQQPGSEIVREFFPDDENGWLHKIEDWFEFNDDVQGFGIITATLTNALTSGGEKKMARYRWTWRPRAIKGTANDFTNLYELVDAMDAAQPEPYATLAAQTIDTREWMRVLAFERFIGNYDSFGFNRGKNMFAYKPERAPWNLLIWDVDFCFGGSGSVSNTDPIASSHDPIVYKFKTHPKFGRQWWASLQDICDSVADPAVHGPRMDMVYTALVNNGQSGLEATSVMKNWIAGRRAYLRSQLALVDAPFTVDAPSEWTTNVNYIALGGSGPVNLDGISVNGSVYRPEWVTTNRWSLYVPLASGTNALTLGGVDWRGVAVTNPPVAVSVISTAEPEPAAGNLVLNEIMYAPTNDGAAFVEVFNRSATTAYDLSGWQVDGLGMTVSNGTVIAPGAFLVFAENISAFSVVHPGVPVAQVYGGHLDHGGETLSLVHPGPTPAEDALISRVTYDDDAPWPGVADGGGPSLQLMDASQDIRRPGCWAAATATPGATNAVVQSIAPFPALWLNEVQPSNVGGPVDRMGDRDPWVEIYNAGTATVSLAGFALGSSGTNVAAWAFPADAAIGAGRFLVVWLDAEPGESVSNEWHATFRAPASTGTVVLARTEEGATNVLDYLTWTGLDVGRSWGSYPDGEVPGRRALYVVTPGAPNDITPPSLGVRINEWMASNSATLADPADADFEDWFELYNPTDVPMDLSGAYLTDDLAVTNKYRVPAGYSVPARGCLLVWADGETGQNSTNRTDLHVSFKLDAAGEALGVFSSAGALVDGLAFGAQATDVAEGRYPNGTGSVFRMSAPSPRAANPPPALNTAPSFAALGRQLVYRGGSFSFTVAAADTNVPAQTVALTMSAAPTGATFNPGTGVFGWTPASEGEAETFGATFVAEDDGEPPLSATQTVALVVLPLPRMQVVPPADGGGAVAPRFSFETLIGYRYQVECTPTLSPPDWQAWGASFVAEGGLYEIVDDGATQRFFRVRQSAP